MDEPRVANDLRVFLAVADHDLNGDIADTREVCHGVLPPDQLGVKTYAEATHGLLQKNIEDSTLRTFTTAVQSPWPVRHRIPQRQPAFVEGSTKACGAAAPTSPRPGVTDHPS
jgi:hypothetical protein